MERQWGLLSYLDWLGKVTSEGLTLLLVGWWSFLWKRDLTLGLNELVLTALMQLFPVVLGESFLKRVRFIRKGSFSKPKFWLPSPTDFRTRVGITAGWKGSYFLFLGCNNWVSAESSVLSSCRCWNWTSSLSCSEQWLACQPSLALGEFPYHVTVWVILGFAKKC